ncbi:uncharacterized protein GGS22DRAFT_65485 [Annulohypoxylon maeteangense]|uniref:uncharacterized protein n=1 Tax=Annulohypoxylon maeteangense TaxID=1927788 RepID=UPI002007E061|nr:uncharacterized protein GGS22DRAFT_65485 [Annulohypoxylon maeteangense]KAI0888973.1 hypothetical protein GGS22DRAFT_65485 [Annulohypoxylon maeteangense]
MASRRAMNITSTGCSHCRLAALKLFANPANANALSSVRAGLLKPRPRLIPAPSIRLFSSRPTHDEPFNSTESAEEGLEGLEDGKDLEDGQDAAKGSDLTNIPWYLQVDPPRHVASIEPQPLPEIPTGSPKVVGSLLEYVSEDLGLDELSLLDLRELYPPPALGPNLFMLFGTARSERHLNVSAGRLLRWLRSKHRIYAQADGLLGPNERKTKLRRKAKRAKLLGGPEDSDDGIRTGWICVNLGTIGRSNDESTVVTDDGRVAGFGVSHSGHTIIVQIMTESRRTEMGLETLWGRALSRSVDKSVDKSVDDSSKSEMGNANNLHPLEQAILSSTRPRAATRDRNFNDTSRRTPFEQKRAYSTQQAIAHDAPQVDPLFTIDSEQTLEQILKGDARQKYRILDLLRLRLGKMSSIDKRKALGIAPNGVTPFVRLSKFACKSLPPHQTWEFRLAIRAIACRSTAGNNVMPRQDIQNLINELNLYGIEATRKQYLQLLTCAYSTAGGLERQYTLAKQLLRTMQQRGEPVIANDIIVTIIEAVCRYSDSGQWKDYYTFIRRLEDTWPQLNLPCMDEPLLMRLMSAHHRIQDWIGIWDAWRMRPKYLLPRSAAMYIHIYRLAMASGRRIICLSTVKRTFQGLLAEYPAVLPNPAVTKALLDCIKIADPHAEEITMRTTDSGDEYRGEFVRIIRVLRLMDS